MKEDAGRNKRRMQDKNAGRLLYKYIYLSLARVRKGCSRVACERELETEYKLLLTWPHGYDCHVVSFSFFSAVQPEA